MSESDIDMDRAMQGIDCEVPKITWTNCADAMPPEFLTDNTKLIVRTLRGNIKCMSVNSLIDYMSELFITEHNIPFESCTRIVTYTEYTPEKWKELNKRTSKHVIEYL